MRKIWDSSKTAWMARLSAWAEARSVPKGFSTMIAGRPGGQPGVAEHVDHRGEGRRRHGQVVQVPRAASDLGVGAAHRRDERRGVGRVGRTEAQCGGKAVPGLPRRWDVPNCATASAGALAEFVVGERERPRRRPDDPVVIGEQHRVGRGWNRPGSSLRLARSPVAPKITITWSSGFGTAIFWGGVLFVTGVFFDAAFFFGALRALAMSVHARSAPPTRRPAAGR